MSSKSFIAATHYVSGVLKYKGQFLNGLYHGKGTLYFENKHTNYKGTFYAGLFHGKGTLYYNNGKNNTQDPS